MLLALREIDAATVAWARFVLAAAGLWLFLRFRARLPPLQILPRRAWGLILVSTICLAGNYVLYTLGMEASNPTSAQIVSQLGPMFMLFGGVLIFHERLSRSQRAGIAMLIFGLILFFNDRIRELLAPVRGFGLGVSLNLAASLVWSVYALAQKPLLRRLEPQQVLVLLYTGSAVLLLGLASPAGIRGMSPIALIALGLCGLNTLFAYGSLAESLKCWEASRVGAVLASTPLFTYAAMKAGALIAPALFVADHLNAASLAGAALVVCGSALCALGGRVGAANAPVSVPGSPVSVPAKRTRAGSGGGGHSPSPPSLP